MRRNAFLTRNEIVDMQRNSSTVRTLCQSIVWCLCLLTFPWITGKAVPDIATECEAWFWQAIWLTICQSCLSWDCSNQPFSQLPWANLDTLKCAASGYAGSVTSCIKVPVEPKEKPFSTRKAEVEYFILNSKCFKSWFQSRVIIGWIEQAWDSGMDTTGQHHDIEINFLGAWLAA